MSKREMVVIGLIALLIVIGLFVLFPGVFEGSSTSESPSGSILISSVNSENLPFLDTYILNVGTGKLIIYEPDTVSQENMYSVSPDRSAVAFLGTTQSLVQNVLSQQTKGDPMQVYSTAFDRTTGALPGVSQAQQLTNDTVDQKSVPVVSNDGSVLYMEIPASAAASSSESTAGYTIQLLSGGSASSTLSVAGMYPQWYGSDSFYYVASDGVRLYDIANGTSTLVIPIAGQSNFKLAVSPDDATLAFVDPDSSTVFVYSISANGYQLTPLKQINVSGYWAVFSPDDAYMAVQSADQSGAPEMFIYDTKDFAQLGSPISLSPLLNDRLFVTAWLP